MSIKLPLKQERFVQGLIKGLSQREAYKQAYSAKYKDAAIDSKASALFKTDKVQKRYNELLGKIENDTILSAEERMIFLSNVVRGTEREKVGVLKTSSDGKEEMIETEFPSKLDTRLKALDTLNKMSGEYTTKVEGELNVTKLEDLL